MAITVSLPELGENIDSGTVTSVLVSVGDTVAVDDPLVELETDKAVVEVPSSEAGVITEIRVEEGGTLEVGGVIVVLEASSGAAAPAKSVPEPEPEPEPEPAPEPEPTPPEEPVAKEPDPKPVAPPKAAQPPVAHPVPIPEPIGKVRASPSVRKLAREIGVNIAAVSALNPKKGVTASDVKEFAKTKMQGASDAKASAPTATSASAPTKSTAPATPASTGTDKWGDIRREEMSTIRKVTVKTMTRSWTTIPHVTQNDLADVTEMEKFRKLHGKSVKDAGGKLTATAILVKVLCEALKRFPEFNSSIDVETSEIIYKQYYNVGIAVDTEHGLIVPNIKNVDQKSLTEIAVEMTEMSERARTRKISLNELQGTCMTITNLGGIGGTSFTPIVNAPEVAILGVSRSRVEPVYIDGAFVPRTMMPISLSYDHRIIDGANAARFARWICETLEHPMVLMLES